MSVKKKIKKEFKEEMEEIYIQCTNTDREGRLWIDDCLMEPEWQMKRMANEALDKILDKYL